MFLFGNIVKDSVEPTPVVLLITEIIIKTLLTIASTPTHNKRLLVSAFVCSCAGEAWRCV
jgi:hypothetical protein